MAATSLRACVTLVALPVMFAPCTASARTIGEAEVGVTRFLGQPFFESIPIPVGATDFTTLPAEVAAQLQLNSDLARVHARAVTGLDIPHGGITGNIAAFARTEFLGGSVRAYAGSFVEFEDTFEVRSDTLPDGTSVDVVFSPVLVHMGGASVTGFGPCCSIRSVYQFRIAASNIYPAERNGVLGGNGFDQQDIQFAVPLGPFTAQAIVGDEFDFSISFKTESEALATAVFERGFGVHAGQSDATASAALMFATEVFPAAAGFTALDAFPMGGASGGNAGYLFHPASGLRLPGLEALDPANVATHLLPLVRVPEPSMLLMAISILGVVPLVGRFDHHSSNGYL